MDKERRQKESDRHAGSHCEPIGQNAPSNVPGTQLQTGLLCADSGVRQKTFYALGFQAPFRLRTIADLVRDRVIVEAIRIITESRHSIPELSCQLGQTEVEWS
jgi:hypothetical protein